MLQSTLTWPPSVSALFGALMITGVTISCRRAWASPFVPPQKYSPLPTQYASGPLWSEYSVFNPKSPLNRNSPGGQHSRVVGHHRCRTTPNKSSQRTCGSLSVLESVCRFTSWVCRAGRWTLRSVNGGRGGNRTHVLDDFLATGLQAFGAHQLRRTIHQPADYALLTAAFCSLRRSGALASIHASPARGC